MGSTDSFFFKDEPAGQITYENNFMSFNTTAITFMVCILYAFPISPMGAICPTDLLLFDLVTITISGEEYKLSTSEQRGYVASKYTTKIFSAWTELLHSTEYPYNQSEGAGIIFKQKDYSISQYENVVLSCSTYAINQKIKQKCTFSLFLLHVWIIRHAVSPRSSSS